MTLPERAPLPDLLAELGAPRDHIGDNTFDTFRKAIASARGPNIKETPVTLTDRLNRAEELAPVPETRGDATRDTWVRHYAAQSLAAFAGFYQASTDARGAEPGSRPDLGYLISHAVSAFTAAFALDTADSDLPGKLWDLTPEAGALNGEWEEWLTDTLDRLGVNPADIDGRYRAGDFRTPSRTVAA